MSKLLFEFMASPDMFIPHQMVSQTKAAEALCIYLRTADVGCDIISSSIGFPSLLPRLAADLRLAHHWEMRSHCPPLPAALSSY